MQNEIRAIVRKHRYTSNKDKCRLYEKNENKRITGGIITKWKTIAPQNKLLQKLQPHIEELRAGQTLTDKQAAEAQGLVTAIQMTDKKMPNLSMALRAKRDN